MQELQIFNNTEFGEVRALEINDEPYFVGKDVATILGYAKPLNALSTHVDEDDSLKQGLTDRLGRKQETILINESGLYSLILSSKLPTAKKFKRWVTSEVLPSIRKHGAYMTPEKIEEALLNPDTLIQLATTIKEEQAKNRALELTNKQQKEQLKRNEPLVVFANSVSVSESSILIGELAKIIKQNGVDIGQKRLFEWLRQKGYLIKRKGSEYNLPTQRAMELGLFEIKENSHINGDGTVKITKTTKVTGKGQIYFINKFLKRK